VDGGVRPGRGGTDDRHHVAAVLDPHHRRDVYELEYRVANAAGSGLRHRVRHGQLTGTIVEHPASPATGTSLVCNKPTGTAANDVLLAVQSGNAAQHDEIRAPGPGGSRSSSTTSASGSLHLKVWTLTAGVGAVDLHVHPGAGSVGVVSIVAVRGVVEAGAHYAVTYDSGTGATRTAPSLDKAVNGSVLICGAMADPGAARTWTPPAGMTEQTDAVRDGDHPDGRNPARPRAAHRHPDFTLSGVTGAAGGIQWSVAFQMPPDPQRGADNKSMISVVRTR
jgi:hypothetical protein